MSTLASATAGASSAIEPIVERRLASHVFCAVYGRDLITLDLQSGDYDLLPGIGETVSLSADRRGLRSEDWGLLAELDALGLFGSESPRAIKPIPALPTRTALVEKGARPGLGDVAWMAMGWIDMLRQYHGKAFGELKEHARQPVMEACQCGLEPIVSSAAMFDRLSIWLPFQGDCLYRCFMLLRRLGPAAYKVDWVFGVRTWPFYAHCWLQIGDICLTDTPDRLVGFSPIMAI